MPLSRPQSDEFAPYYAPYIGKVADGDVLKTLESQIALYRDTLGSLDDAAALHRYAPGKWTVKEVIGHVIDTERIFAYRAMRIAREDATPLPGFDENQYVRAATFNSRSLADLLSEFEFGRRGNLHLFGSFGGDVQTRRGTANDLSVTVRAIVYITAGHAAHHLGVLKDKYLK
jgi:hypothetical protein